MTKKITKPATESKTVKVKILREIAQTNQGRVTEVFHIGERGKEVEMSEKEETYIKRAVTQMLNAQKILAKYYNE